MTRLALGCAVAVGLVVSPVGSGPAGAAETLLIAVSPSVKAPVEALARAFEEAHPNVRVRLHVDSALDLRRTIAAVHNDGRHGVGTGAVHLVAPGADELLDRLEQRYYVLPGTRRVYAVARLALVVPESFVEGPESLEQVARTAGMRLAVGDPVETDVGWRTRRVLQALGLLQALEGRMDVGANADAVLDHVLKGRADVGLLFTFDALRERDRIRISGVVRNEAISPVPHSVAMDRFCPNRRLCQAFLDFTQSPAGRDAIRQLGYEFR